MFTFDLHFISAFHLLCFSQGKQELVPCDKQSGAADASSHPLNFQINKINTTLPTPRMKGTSFWRSLTRITGVGEDVKGRCGVGVPTCAITEASDHKGAEALDTIHRSVSTGKELTQRVGDPRLWITWQGTDLNIPKLGILLFKKLSFNNLLSKIHKALPNTGMKGTSFWRSPELYRSWKGR